MVNKFNYLLLRNWLYKLKNNVTSKSDKNEAPICHFYRIYLNLKIAFFITPYKTTISN